MIDVYHSHDARVSIRNLGVSAREIDVAQDQLILRMAELTGNIWMPEPESKQ